MTVSLCVAGCGRYARRVFGGLRTRPEGLRLYFASRDEAKARRFNEEFGGAGHFGSYEDAAASPEIDALYFTTPHHVHVENARLAAHHSKHILVEKPIARDTEESLQIIESARAAGVRLMIAENFRFLPTVVKARAMIAGGDIGEVRLMRVWSESHRSPSGWRANAGLRGGGPLIDGGIHWVDVMVNLCGFPEAVSAVTLPKAHSTEGRTESWSSSASGRGGRPSHPRHGLAGGRSWRRGDDRRLGGTAELRTVWRPDRRRDEAHTTHRTPARRRARHRPDDRRVRPVHRRRP